MGVARSSNRFIGRQAELSALEQRYNSARSAMVPVYGRRRVGKTELLLRFSSGKPTVYFTASDKLRTPQIADFMRAAADWLHASHLADSMPTNWEAALRLVVASAPDNRKLLLVLDEFQWLCQSSPEVPSVIQRLWDLDWQRSNRLMLVLCGSLIGFMEREVMGARSPLHGRRTSGWNLSNFARQRIFIRTGHWRRNRALTLCAAAYPHICSASNRVCQWRRPSHRNSSRSMVSSNANLIFCCARN